MLVQKQQYSHLQSISTLDLNICSNECSNVHKPMFNLFNMFNNTALQTLPFCPKKAEIQYIPHNALLDKPSSLEICITEANKVTNLLESLCVQFLRLVQS